MKKLVARSVVVGWILFILLASHTMIEFVVKGAGFILVVVFECKMIWWTIENS